LFPFANLAPEYFWAGLPSSCNSVTAPSAAAIFHRRVGTEAVDYNDLDWPVKLRDYGPQTVANGARGVS